jgi:hypothetical protein
MDEMDIFGQATGPQPVAANWKNAGDVWEKVRRDASSDEEAFGRLLARIVLELQDLRSRSGD